MHYLCSFPCPISSQPSSITLYNVILNPNLKPVSDLYSMELHLSPTTICCINIIHLQKKLPSLKKKKEKRNRTTEQKTPHIHLEKHPFWSPDHVPHAKHSVYKRETQQKFSLVTKIIQPQRMLLVRRQAVKVGHSQICPVRGQWWTIDSLQAVSPTFCLT